jgi:hypothetical protein
MTTLWKPEPCWQGETVAVLCSGPSMDEYLALSAITASDRVIAVKYTVRLAPDADMLVALDAGWPTEFREFAGLRVTGVEDPDLDALYIGHVFERVLTEQSGRIEIRNSGLAAVRVAAAMGAARIVVAGFEPEARARWHDDEVRPYQGVREGMEQIVRELRAQGVAVEYLNA